MRQLLPGVVSHRHPYPLVPTRPTLPQCSARGAITRRSARTGILAATNRLPELFGRRDNGAATLRPILVRLGLLRHPERSRGISPSSSHGRTGDSSDLVWMMETGRPSPTTGVADN